MFKKVIAVLKLHAKDDKAKQENEKIQQQFYAFFTEDTFNQKYCEKFNASLQQRKNVKVSENYRSKFEISLICNKLQTLLPNLDIMQALTEGPIPLLHIPALKNYIEKNTNPLLLRRVFAFLEASRLSEHPLNKAILEEYRGILLKRAAEGSQYLSEARRKTRSLNKVGSNVEADKDQSFFHKLQNLLAVNKTATTLGTHQAIFSAEEAERIQIKLETYQGRPMNEIFTADEIAHYHAKMQQRETKSVLRAHTMFNAKPTSTDSSNLTKVIKSAL